jgi:hypothetical protein
MEGANDHTCIPWLNSDDSESLPTPALAVREIDGKKFARAAPIIFEVGRAGPSGLLLEEAHQVARIREAVRIGQLADAAPLEQQQGHIAVFPIIGVEQRELLRAICVGIRVIGINDDGINRALSYTKR